MAFASDNLVFCFTTGCESKDMDQIQEKKETSPARLNWRRPPQAVSEMGAGNVVVNTEQKHSLLHKYPCVAIPNLTVHGQPLPRGGVNNSI